MEVNLPFIPAGPCQATFCAPYNSSSAEYKSVGTRLACLRFRPQKRVVYFGQACQLPQPQMRDTPKNQHPCPEQHLRELWPRYSSLLLTMIGMQDWNCPGRGQIKTTRNLGCFLHKFRTVGNPVMRIMRCKQWRPWMVEQPKLGQGQ